MGEYAQEETGYASRLQGDVVLRSRASLPNVLTARTGMRSGAQSVMIEALALFVDLFGGQVGLRCVGLHVSHSSPLGKQLPVILVLNDERHYFVCTGPYHD